MIGFRPDRIYQMNIRKEMRRRFQKGDIIKTWRITRCKETIFSFSFYSVKWQIEDDYFLQDILLRLNRGRTDKTSTSSNRGRTDKTSTSYEPGPHGKLLYPNRINTANRWKSSNTWPQRKFLEDVQKRIIN